MTSAPCPYCSAIQSVTDGVFRKHYSMGTLCAGSGTTPRAASLAPRVRP